MQVCTRWCTVWCQSMFFPSLVFPITFLFLECCSHLDICNLPKNPACSLLDFWNLPSAVETAVYNGQYIPHCFLVMSMYYIIKPFKFSQLQNEFHALTIRTRSRRAVWIFTILFFRGVHGHMNGERPWIFGDECIVKLMADIVGRNNIFWTLVLLKFIAFLVQYSIHYSSV